MTDDPQDRQAAVRVVTITVHPDGGFTIRGTVGRDEVPVILRAAADQVEGTDKG